MPNQYQQLSLVAAIAAAAIGTAGAEESENTSGESEVITVYGTSNPLPVFDYPGQVTVIDRDQIDLRLPSTISDALRDVPGMDFAGGPRRTGELPSIRGLSGQNVLILLDGARQSFTSAHDGRFFVDPDLINMVEVVRGPASALYGSGAVGGVLALETVDAEDLLVEENQWGARLRLGHQSVNEETLASLTGYTRQGPFDGVISVGIRQSGDIELGSGADLPSDDEIETGLVKLSYDFAESLSVSGSWQRFANTAIEPNNGQGTLGTGDGVLDRDVEKDITSDTVRLSARFNPSENGWIDLTTTAYTTDTAVEEFDDTVPRTTIRDIETTGISIRNASRLDLGSFETTLTVGGDWYKDEQIGVDDQTVDGIRGGVPNGESDFTGIFAQVETVVATPLGEILLVPGIRYDEFETASSVAPDDVNSDNATSPRFAASYTPSAAPWLRVFGSYAEGFRAPSINELYLDGVHFSVPHPVLFDPTAGSFVFVPNNFVPNPDLVPESTQTTEFGFGVTFDDIATDGDRFQAKISRYETFAEDLINLTVNAAPDPSCFAPPFFQPCTFGTSTSANVDEAELDGWEGEFHYDSPRLFARASYSTVNGTNTINGSDLGSLSPDRLALNIGTNIPEWNSLAGMRVQFAEDFERREADGNGGFVLSDQRKAYSIVDFYASWEPTALPNLRLDLGIDNAFDEDYERVFQGVSEPGRNVKLSATYRFGG